MGHGSNSATDRIATGLVVDHKVSTDQNVVVDLGLDLAADRITVGLEGHHKTLKLPDLTLALDHLQNKLLAIS